MSDRNGQPQDPPSKRVIAFVLLITLAAAGVAVAIAPLAAPTSPNWLALPLLTALLFAATWFMVPFRYGGSVDASNLVEAALAPLLIAFPPIVVVTLVALSQVSNGILRRLPWVKTLFNTAMWTLAAGLGASVVSTAGAGPLWPDQVLGLLAALAVVGLVNALAVAAVLRLAEGPRPGRARRHLAGLHLSWFGGWVANAGLGVLFALAYLSTPAAAVFFVVPLVVLHLAYGSYTTARADQALLAAVHGAASRLTEPLQPLSAASDFLRELAACFDAAAAELVLRIDAGRQVHRLDRASDQYTIRQERADVASLEGILAASSGPVRVSADSEDPIARALGATGATNCLAAPLLEGDRLIGAVLVLDRGGFQGSPAGEIAVLESLARETTGALAKGRLLANVLEERRKLAEIVGSASDGICSLAKDGTVLTWNPAFEQITGVTAPEAIGRADIFDRLRVRTSDDEPVRLHGRPIASLPTDLRLTAVDGGDRHLTCSYSAGDRGAGAPGAALIVVARDVTPVEEHEALRERFDLLVEAEEARRMVVEQLQEAVMPAPLVVPGAQIAAAYESSDPSAPTGGDLYDWQDLGSGEVHIAVVDVLGHGVAATKDALAVIHTLRVVAASETPLETVVARADELLGAQHPDLVATVLVARYEPATGVLRVAAGGHPPALVVSPGAKVRQVNATGGVIGWPNAGSDNVVETVLEPGDALLMYTDGLVEARKNILDGMEALERYAAEVADLPAQRFARELVERALAGADRRDDALALVLRRDRADVAGEHGSWECLPAEAEASVVRRAVQEWLVDRGVDGGDSALAAGELLSNAVRAARNRIALRIELRPDEIVIDVSDDGVGPVDLDDYGHTLPGERAESGWGLYVVRALSKRVDVLATIEGSTVRAVLPRFPLDAPEPDEAQERASSPARQVPNQSRRAPLRGRASRG